MKTRFTKKKLLAILVILTVVLMLFVQGLLPAFAASAPNIISYQGRILTTAGAPVTASSASMIFRLYTAVSGGTCLWSNSSASCASSTAISVTLTDGLFSVNLGDTSASFAAVGDSIFADNTTVYLDVTINSESLTPRRQIVAAPYALNAENLDGYDSSQGGGTSAFVPVADTNGNLTLTGTPQSSGVAGGALTINPSSADADETLFGIGLVGSNRFRVDEDGDLFFVGDMTVDNAFDIDVDDNTTEALTISEGSTNYLSLTTTNSAEVLAIGASGLTQLTFTTDNNADDDFNFVGGTTFNDDVVISAGSGEVFEVSRILTDAATENGVTLTVTASDSSSSTSSQRGLSIRNNASNEALDAMISLSNDDGNDTVGAGLQFGTGAAGTDFNYGIDLDASEIGTADIRFENSGTLDEGTAGSWIFDRSASGTVTLIGTDDDTNTAVTLSSSGTGTLSLDPTGAGGIVVGSADVTSISFMTDNTADTDMTFAGGVTFSDDVVISAGEGEVFEVTRGFTNATAEDGLLVTITASDTTSSTLAQHGLAVVNAASSEAIDFGVFVNNSDDDDTVGAAFGLGSGGSGTDFSYGIDFDNATIGTADIRFENSGTLDESTLGTWTFDRATSGTVTIAATDDDANAALTVSSGGTGLLTLDSGSGTVSLGTSDGFLFGGSLTAGDGTGSDLFTFSTGATTTDAMSLTADSVTTADVFEISADGLTTGTALKIVRADNVTDYDGAIGAALFTLTQENDNAGSDGHAAIISNRAGGASVGLYVVQNGVDAPAANGVSQQAVVIDINEAAGDNVADETVFLIRSDTDGVADTEFRVQLDGDVAYDGTASSPASDVAEVYPSEEILQAGDVVMLDTSSPGRVKKTTGGYAQTLFGAISTKPALRMGSDIVGYDVALTGRIPLKISAENGAVAVGDPLTSSSTAGYAMKATEPGMIVGFALEAHSAGLGTIEAFVDAEWSAGSVLTTDGNASVLNDKLVLTSLGTASATASYGSNLLTFRGSGWDGVQSTSVSMTLAAAVTNGTAATRLSVGNSDGVEVAYVSAEGNFALSGRLYPSDRGALQTSKYIYYDGSAGAGGDFMRTNASGWATGSYDFAEMFPSSEALVSGDVVIFSGEGESVRRSMNAYDTKLAGIVSTRPGFLAGDNTPDQYPIALAGRVPTNVTNEAGAIAVGDPLTSSTVSGYAMKATTPGPIVGYALEATDSERDAILVFVRSGWFGGEATTTLPGTENTASQVSTVASVSNLEVVTTRRIESVGGNWSIAEDGTFRTHGLLTTVTQTDAGTEVELYALASSQVTVMLSGTSTLQNGTASIVFEEIDENFNDVISSTEPIRVLVTPNGPISPLFVSHRERNGFVVSELGGVTNGVSFDWLVMAYRAGFEPAQGAVEEPASQESSSESIDPDVEEEVAEGEPVVESESTEEPVEPVVEMPIAEAVVEAPTAFVVDTTIEPAPLTVVE